MKNFKVNGALGEFELSLPESLEEIPVDYFKQCTDFVHPAPNYALVAIVYKDSLLGFSSFTSFCATRNTCCPPSSAFFKDSFEMFLLKSK